MLPLIAQTVAAGGPTVQTDAGPVTGNAPGVVPRMQAGPGGASAAGGAMASAVKA